MPRQDQAENVGAILSHSTPAFRRRVTPKARTSLRLSPTGVATINYPSTIPKRHGSFNNMATISVKRAESGSITSVEITTSAEIVSVGDGVLRAYVWAATARYRLIPLWASRIDDTGESTPAGETQFEIARLREDLSRGENLCGSELPKATQEQLGVETGLSSAAFYLTTLTLRSEDDGEGWKDGRILTLQRKPDYPSEPTEMTGAAIEEDTDEGGTAY